MDCCEIYRDEFDHESAVSQAQRYRTRGLDRPARAILSVLDDRGVDGARVLEFGGGIGGLSLELVKAGAASALNIELSTAYEKAATALALEAGLEGRVGLRAGDAIDLADDLEPAEIVVMNKVVCCYPDGDRLMDTAADRSSRFLGVSFPTVHPLSRLVIGLENRLRVGRGSSFRAFVHPQSTIDRPLRSGFREIYRRTGPVWSVRVWERAAA